MNKPMEKLKERVSMWKDQPLGLFWGARVFNTFVVRILSFVAPLEDPPEWVLQGIENVFRKVDSARNLPHKNGSAR